MKKDDRLCPEIPELDRSVGRIPRILKKLEEYWLENPELRLGQLVVNLTSIKNRSILAPEIFYLEDYELEEFLDRMVGLPEEPKEVNLITDDKIKSLEEVLAELVTQQAHQHSETTAILKNILGCLERHPSNIRHELGWDSSKQRHYIVEREREKVRDKEEGPRDSKVWDLTPEK